MGEHHRRSPSFDVALHELVGILAHHLDDLVLERLVDRLTVTEGQRIVGAPPMELGSSVTPIGSLPFSQRVGRSAFVIAATFETQRQLPAHARLPIERTLTGLERAPVRSE